MHAFEELRVSLMFSPNEDNRYLKDTLGSDDTNESFFDYIRKESGYDHAKKHKIKSAKFTLCSAG